MAYSNENNVFGEPILEGDRKKRATDAYENQTVGDKLGQAREYLTNQQELSTDEVCTLGLFYNATGETLVYRTDKSWDGSAFGDDPYPRTVKNGQWGAFLHLGGNCRSSGYVIYDGNNSDTNRSSQLICWDNPVGWQKPYNNHAYCKICNEGDIDEDNVIKQNLDQSSDEKSAKRDGLYTLVTIGDDTSPYYKATLTREDAVKSPLREAASQPDANASSAT